MNISQQNNSRKAVNLKSVNYSQSLISGFKLAYFEGHNNNNKYNKYNNNNNNNNNREGEKTCSRREDVFMSALREDLNNSHCST